MNSTKSAVNRLTSSLSDSTTHTPAYKEVAVSMQVLPEVEESPLPRNNSRFGHPTPQRGVQVERKWRRSDYSVPGPPLVQIRIPQKQEWNAMAHPIALDLPVRDPRVELQRRLEDAPAEHAAALLAGYEVLQGLNDSGALDLVRGALGSRDKVLGVAVDAAESPRSIRAIRNLLLLGNMLSEIDPEVLKVLTQTGPEALKSMVCKPERPGLWRLIKDFLWNKDFRYGLAGVNTMLEVFGRRLSAAKCSDKNSAAR